MKSSAEELIYLHDAEFRRMRETALKETESDSRDEHGSDLDQD